MTDFTPTPAADPLAPLQARVASADAQAADWLAYGRSLFEHAGRDTERLRAALDALVRAHQLASSANPALLSTIAQTAFMLRDWPLVESASALLLARDAADLNALVWRAAAVQQRDAFDEAERLLCEAARAAPLNPVVLHKLALCIKEQGRFAEAEQWLRRVLELAPHSPHARFDLSELEIRAARFVPGWANYEARLAFDDPANAAQQALAALSPYWRGEPLAGKTLLVYGEQGHGDCLWAMRFVPELAQRVRDEGGRLIFGYDGPLRPLLERVLPAGVPLETSLHTHPDFHCALMSLPLRSGVANTANAASGGQPYLRVDAVRSEAWRARVAAAASDGRKRVGLVWNGNPEHVRDARRSVPAAQLEPLLATPGVSWFALSPGRSASVAQWHAQGIDIVDPTVHYTEGFDDVAALMANLDLIVTIDSGPAHLAGALGVPTCLMIDYVSAWFWGDDPGAQRTPWYDSVELLRQPAPGAWAPVLARVRAKLAAAGTPRGIVTCSDSSVRRRPPA